MALITPLKALATPTAPTLALSNNINGPIMDVPGAFKLAVEQAQELTILLNNIIAVTDAADPNLTVLQAGVTTLS